MQPNFGPVRLAVVTVCSRRGEAFGAAPTTMRTIRHATKPRTRNEPSAPPPVPKVSPFVRRAVVALPRISHVRSFKTLLNFACTNEIV